MRPRDSFFRFQGAPPQNLPFPVDANITAVELLTFLPNCLTSTDIVYRFASNQATCDAILSIVNTNRILQKPWITDYCYRTLRNAMRRGGHDNWTLNKHEDVFSKVTQSWDAASINVGGYRTLWQITREGTPVTDVPFASLANGVRNMPQGDDALDLTRMVQYCVQNPHERWMYPTLYGALLQRLDGPKKPGPASADNAIFVRWEHVVPRVPRSRPRAMSSAHSTPEPKMQAPRRTGRPGRPSKKRLEILEEEFSEIDTSKAEEDGGEYIREPIRWVKPPPTSDDFSEEALDNAFGAQPSSSTHDPFDAYAFGSEPRAVPPFRPLQLIHGLKFDDLSGWAENLRWAAEQYSTFGEMGWTECPEHMEQIAQIRKAQTWASAELFIAFSDNQEQEEEEEAWVQAMTEGTLASMNRRDAHARVSMRVPGDIAEERIDARGVVWRPYG